MREKPPKVMTATVTNSKRVVFFKARGMAQHRGNTKITK